MISVIAFFCVLLICIFINIRIYLSIKKTPNKFSLYLFWGLLFYIIGQIFLIVFILIYFFSGKQNIFLLYGDYFSRLFVYFCAAAVAQMPLYLYFPKSKKRIIVSYVIAIFGLAMFFYNLTQSYTPYLYSNGIINFNPPTIFGIIYNLPLAFIWILATMVFLIYFFKSKFTSYRSLFFGIGFLMATLSSIFVDYAMNSFQYILIYFFFVMGFIIIFWGLFIEEKKSTAEL